ncbi:MAG: branched-chain amino acid transporter2C amino acid-binding protein [Labilithrix sp.]|nr:branched-chain amino acid transporter2C amino acid-binding protein [Labilithrix sp.]
MNLSLAARASLSVFCLAAAACSSTQDGGTAAPTSPEEAGDAAVDAGPSKTPSPDAGDASTPGNPPPGNPPPATLKWTARASMPTRRSRLGAVFAPDGKLYAIGGSTDSGPTGVVEVYDPALDSWSLAAPMPTPRYGLSALLLPSGKILVSGGEYNSKTFTEGVSRTVEIYDPAADSWTTAPSLPEGRYMGAGSMRADGSVLFAGGYSIAANAARSSTYVLAPGAAAWTAGSPMTSPRTSLAMTTGADGTTYAFGGSDGASDLATAEARGPSATGFSTLPPMPDTRGGGHSAVLGKDGRIYVIGGGNVPVLVYEPAAKAWTAGPVPPTCQEFAATAVAPDGTIYAVGGEPGMYINDVIALTK